MSKLFARFVKDESGATAIEYGLIAALIALAIMVGAGGLGNSLNNQFSRHRDQAERQRDVISGDHLIEVEQAACKGGLVRVRCEKCAAALHRCLIAAS